MYFQSFFNIPLQFPFRFLYSNHTITQTTKKAIEYEKIGSK